MNLWKKNKKQYSSIQEYEHRFNNFKSSLAKIDELNSKGTGARFGVTKFSDLSSEEFSAKYLNYVKSPEKKISTPIDISFNGELPVNFDWRNKSAVTPVKNQEQCGSCWAFSATEAIESQWFLAGHPLPILGPQQIVDCDVGNGDYGCEGGDTTTAYEYVIKTGGMESENSYPYVGENGVCNFNTTEVVATITNWAYITQNKNETEMQYGLVAKGPLSICVDAQIWQYYDGGVITDFCGDQLDHCVMITGYGNYVDDIWGTYQIWYIRNSWGEDFGYNGYIYVERGYNLCGVADEVTLPII